MQHASRHHHDAGESVLAAVSLAVGRLLDRGYLHAAMAVCALTASADGEVSFEERYAIDAALDRDPLLERFGTVQSLTVLDDQLARLREEPEGAREALLQVVERAGRRPDRAVALMRLAWEVITADDVIDPAELMEFEMLCDLLGVDPEEVRGEMLGL